MSPGKFIICGLRYICLCYRFPSLALCHRFTYSLLFISYFLCRVLLLFCVFQFLDFLSHFILPLFLPFHFAYRVLYFSPSASWFLQFHLLIQVFWYFIYPLFLLLRSLFLIHIFISLVRPFHILSFLWPPHFIFYLFPFPIFLSQFPQFLPYKHRQKICMRVIIAIA